MSRERIYLNGPSISKSDDDPKSVAIRRAFSMFGMFPSMTAEYTMSGADIALMMQGAFMAYETAAEVAAEEEYRQLREGRWTPRTPE